MLAGPSGGADVSVSGSDDPLSDPNDPLHDGALLNELLYKNVNIILLFTEALI